MAVVAAIDDQPPAPEHQRLADQLVRLQQVTSALAGARTEEAVGDVVVDVVVPALGADGGVLALVTPGRQLRVVRSLGYGQQYAYGGATYDLDAAIPLTEAARTGRPMNFSSADDRLARFAGAGRIEFAFQSMLAAPLALGGDVLGVVAVTFVENR